MNVGCHDLRAQLGDAAILLTVPAASAFSALVGAEGAAALMVALAVLALLALAVRAEREGPALGHIMSTAVLAALAAAGRVALAPFPDIKPVSAIAIVAGTTLGPRSGFAVGALAALASNLFFGQGPWTPMQMYAWGLVGYLGGILAGAGAFGMADGGGRQGETRALGRRVLLVYGFASGLLYGAVLNMWHVLAFVRPLSWQGALAAFLAALPLDLLHGGATAAFLALIWAPWCRAICRVVARHSARGTVATDL